MPSTLQRLFRSDDLFGYRQLCLRFTGRQDLGKKLARVPDPITVVVDTSQVVHQILWAVRRKRQPEARTDLAEVVDSRLIRAYAPEQLREEIEAKIPLLAADKILPEDALWREWRELEKSLVFERVRNYPVPKNTRDPKDLPFVRLAKRLRAVGILTHDRDIPAMGGRTIKTKTLTKLRDYARAKSAAVGSLVSMVFWGFLVLTLIRPLVTFLAKGIKCLFERLGWPGIIALLVICGVILYASKGLREWIKSKWRLLTQFGREGWDRIQPHVIAVVDDYAQEELRARSLWKEISGELRLPPEPQLRIRDLSSAAGPRPSE